jgi:RES domain-containing protein
MMHLFRISKREYIEDLSGFGAGLYGGRWNSKGINMVYTAENISLAYLEFFVHNYHILETTHVCLARIEIADKAPVQHLSPDEIPGNLNTSRSYTIETRSAGDDFIKEGKFYALKIPSAIVPGEFNLLLNPLHLAHKQTKIIGITDPLVFDVRLFQNMRSGAIRNL